MKIAVISDTHDHLHVLDRVMKRLNRHKVNVLLHCGDLCSPFMIDALAVFRGHVHIVFGNNEGDRYTIGTVSRRFSNITIHGEAGFLETEDGEIAFTHRPEFARGLASTGRYTAVFYGHTHLKRIERVAHTWLVNPGELMGLLEPPGWIMFDLGAGTARHYDAT